jgi:hypothetical protein
MRRATIRLWRKHAGEAGFQLDRSLRNLHQGRRTGGHTDLVWSAAWSLTVRAPSLRRRTRQHAWRQRRPKELISSPGTQVLNAAWSPDGARIVTVSGATRFGCGRQPRARAQPPRRSSGIFRRRGMEPSGAASLLGAQHQVREWAKKWAEAKLDHGHLVLSAAAWARRDGGSARKRPLIPIWQVELVWERQRSGNWPGLRVIDFEVVSTSGADGTQIITAASLDGTARVLGQDAATGEGSRWARSQPCGWSLGSYVL